MTITWACGQNWKTCHDSASSSSSDPEAGGQSEDHTQPGSLRQHSLWPESPQRRWAHRPAWQLRRPQHRRPMWAVLPTTPFSPFCGFCKPQDGEGTEIQLMRNQREPFTAACALRGRTSPSLWRQELGRGTLLMIVGVLVPSRSLVEMVPTKPLHVQGPSDSFLVGTAPRLCLFFSQQLVNGRQVLGAKVQR